MDKPSKELAENLYDAIDYLTQYLPDFIYPYIIDAKRILAILIIICIFLTPLNYIFNLKVTKTIWHLIKTFFQGAKKEAFSEPTYRGWYTNLSPRIQKGMFCFLCIYAAVSSLFFFLFGWVYWYPVFVVPYAKVKYGIVSYLIVMGFGSFCVFVGVLYIGTTLQYYKLIKKVKEMA
ncbi:hypothetical protein [Geotalea uraniireducens]|uniref:Uncharacterized protein n=1 Tax=Geotalea uraniireducens (strain Rf4) TaxID=351605 RepID=A5GF31_GEOUR|nr:hypothetical protein [Geotalea uraniireducens]ABQ26036.1 hypothetical protein Gura_1846 [Geotalea uraniireducens Rf4]